MSEAVRTACPTCGTLQAIPSGIAAGLARCQSCGYAMSGQHAPTQRRPQHQTRQTTLTITLSAIVKHILFSLVLPSVGLALMAWGWSTGEDRSMPLVIFGGILLGMGVLVAFAALFDAGFGGKGVCPICSTEIASIEGRSTLLCRGCREYLQVEQRKVQQLSLATIAAEPQFAAPTPWSDLKVVSFRAEATPVSTEDRVLHADWPHACCVCGDPPTYIQNTAFTVFAPPSSLIKKRPKRVNLIVNGTPYCDVHRDGISLSCIDLDRKDDYEDPFKPDLVFKFRSYAYRNKFIALNPWPWR